jgi:hypothetical protein
MSFWRVRCHVNWKKLGLLKTRRKCCLNFKTKKPAVNMRLVTLDWHTWVASFENRSQLKCSHNINLPKLLFSLILGIILDLDTYYNLNVLQLRPIEKFWANLTATIIDYKLKLSFQINIKIFRSQPQFFTFQFDAHTKHINPKTTLWFQMQSPILHYISWYYSWWEQLILYPNFIWFSKLNQHKVD